MWKIISFLQNRERTNRAPPQVTFIRCPVTNPLQQMQGYLKGEGLLQSLQETPVNCFFSGVCLRDWMCPMSSFLCSESGSPRGGQAGSDSQPGSHRRGQAVDGARRRGKCRGTGGATSAPLASVCFSHVLMQSRFTRCPGSLQAPEDDKAETAQIFTAQARNGQKRFSMGEVTGEHGGRSPRRATGPASLFSVARDALCSFRLNSGPNRSPESFPVKECWLSRHRSDTYSFFFAVISGQGLTASTKRTRPIKR